MILRLTFTCLLIGLLAVGCENQSAISTKELETKWISLYQEGGCLTGGQHWGPGASEGSEFRKRKWRKFFKLPPQITIPFLMDRLDSTAETNIHVCPFNNATEGELAVYVSEHIIRKNWFDSNGDYDKLKMWGEKKKKVERPLTQLMLQDNQTKEELKKFFLSKTAKKDFQPSSSPQ